MSKNRIEVVFEHRSWGFVWRGVKGSDGGYRVEKRGVNAKRWSIQVWGGIDVLDQYRLDGALMSAKYRRLDYLRKLRREIERCRKTHSVKESYRWYVDCERCKQLSQEIDEAYRRN